MNHDQLDHDQLNHDQLDAILRGPLEREGFELVDLVLSGIGSPAATVQVLVDRLPGSERIDLDGVSAATRVVSALLDEHDPSASPYTLEVSSPGLERPLRTPAHFLRFVGTTVSIKTRPGTAGDRRIEGRLDLADADETGSVLVNGRTIPYADIDRARTVFVWGPSPKPGGPKAAKAGPKAAKAGPKSAKAGPKSATADQQPGREREGVIR